MTFGSPPRPSLRLWACHPSRAVRNNEMKPFHESNRPVAYEGSIFLARVTIRVTQAVTLPFLLLPNPFRFQLSFTP